MASTAAQDEFNDLVSSKSKLNKHPQDDSDNSSVGSTTLAPSSIAPTTASNTRERRPQRAGNLARSRTSFYSHDSSDEDEEPESCQPSTYYLPNEYQAGAMTGPKGVIADAQAFEREKYGNKNGIRDNENFERTRDLALPRTQRIGESPHRRSSAGKRLGIEEDIEEEIDSDGLEKWRAKRMDELKKGSKGYSKIRKRPNFGSLDMVDAMGYLHAIEKSSRGAVVAVFIYDDESALSDAFATHLSDLASKYPHVHFVALHYQEAEMEPAGVPALIAYRNGDKFADLVPLVDEVPFTCNVVTNLEMALQRQSILS